MQATHGNVVGMLLGGERVVLVADPQVAEEVLISKSAAVAKVGFPTNTSQLLQSRRHILVPGRSF